MPRTYSATTVLLVQKNNVLPSIANPTRNSVEDGSGFRGIPESILSHDNLAQIVKPANLLYRFEAERAPILRLKDKVLGTKKLTEQEALTNMIYTLEKRISVTLDGSSSTVTLSAEWSSAQTAHLIASLIQKNFMEQRYAAEVSIFEEGIAILEERVSKEQQAVDSALAQVVRAREEAAGRAVDGPATGTAATSPATPKHAPAAAPVGRQARDRAPGGGQGRRAPRAEENRRHQIAEATKALAELSTTYAGAPARHRAGAQARASPHG